MAFVVDDLVGWLVGLLAEAGRKKLTTLVLGCDQERAQRKASGGESGSRWSTAGWVAMRNPAG